MSLKEVLNNHKQLSNLNQQQSIKPMNVLDERLNSIDVARKHQQYLFYSHYRVIYNIHIIDNNRLYIFFFF